MFWVICTTCGGEGGPYSKPVDGMGYEAHGHYRACIYVS